MAGLRAKRSGRARASGTLEFGQRVDGFRRLVKRMTRPGRTEEPRGAPSRPKAGAALSSRGWPGECWLAGNTGAPSRLLVASETWDRRGGEVTPEPRVAPAERKRQPRQLLPRTSARVRPSSP